MATGCSVQLQKTSFQLKQVQVRIKPPHRGKLSRPRLQDGTGCGTIKYGEPNLYGDEFAKKRANFGNSDKNDTTSAHKMGVKPRFPAKDGPNLN